MLSRMHRPQWESRLYPAQRCVAAARIILKSLFVGVPFMSSLPRTLGELRRSIFSEERLRTRRVKDELRENLTSRLRTNGDASVFPGIVGYDDTVVPQIINAILSRHNFILLGLRGQAKSRILRALTTLLDPHMPYLAGCEVHDNPYAPICRRCREEMARLGEDSPIAYLSPDDRYVEKLATPDVTIADLIGDIDPIKAARGGHELSSELTVHYGLLPRANRGIFAINELPDLAGKIQVGLFNIMQEGDVQIKGLSHPAAVGCGTDIQRESGRLHSSRQDYYAAKGSYRLGNSHALSGDRGGRNRDHRTGGLDPAQRASHAPAELCAGGD
jgi:hypothetical protein